MITVAAQFCAAAAHGLQSDRRKVLVVSSSEAAATRWQWALNQCKAAVQVVSLWGSKERRESAKATWMALGRGKGFLVLLTTSDSLLTVRNSHSFSVFPALHMEFCILGSDAWNPASFVPVEQFELQRLVKHSC